MSERTDTERLDWLETNRYQVSFHQFGKYGVRRINKWIVWDCIGAQCRKLATDLTIRKTIDIAMDAEERG